ncbi:MAG: helix-turn-helix domain-containing protein [Alphaproteobacteria bacterium]|nr:helix-turn-helix domain-containing protein [Alphaproteobacteria bacterium]
MIIQKRKTKGSPDSVDVHVGNRLRIRRSLLGLSQEKLAEAVGLTFQQVQKYERGINRISAGRLFQFSRILDVPITYFYEQVQNIGRSAYAGLSDDGPDDYIADDDVMNNKETLALVRAYYAIKDPEARKDIVKFIKSMADRLGTEE